jgi:hypothetical protein
MVAYLLCLLCLLPFLVHPLETAPTVLPPIPTPYPHLLSTTSSYGVPGSSSSVAIEWQQDQSSVTSHVSGYKVEMSEVPLERSVVYDWKTVGVDVGMSEWCAMA